MNFILELDLSGALLAIFAAFSFATSVIFVRKATTSGSPEEAVITTIWFNVLVYLSLSLIFYPRLIVEISIWTASFFLVSGLIGTFLGRIFMFSGIEKVGASKTVPITRSNVLVAVLFGLFILGEHVTKGHLLGIIFLIIGVILVSYEIESNSGKSISKVEPSPTLLFPLLAMICLGLESPISKIGLSQGVPVTVGLAIKFIAALTAISGYFLVKGKSPVIPFSRAERNLYISAALFNTVGMGFFYTALNVSRVVVVLPFIGISPAFVLILSYFFLRKLEKITWILVLGSLLVIAGTIAIGIHM